MARTNPNKINIIHHSSGEEEEACIETLYIAIIGVSITTHFIIASLPFTRQLHTLPYCEKLARL